MSKIKPFILLIAFCILATEAFCVVDPLSGTYSNQATDVILRYQSIQLEITRSYNSVLSSAFPGKSRPWFFHPFDKEIFVFEDKGQVLLQDGSGIKDFRKSESEAIYRSARNEKILFENGTYTLTLANGIQEIFDGNGKLTGIRYPDGNSLSLLFNSNQLERITSNDSELLHFYYNSTGQVEQIKTFRVDNRPSLS